MVVIFMLKLFIFFLNFCNIDNFSQSDDNDYVAVVGLSSTVSKEGTKEMRGCVCSTWPICMTNCSSDKFLYHSLSDQIINQVMLASLHKYHQTPFLLTFPYQIRKKNSPLTTSTLNKVGEHFKSAKFVVYLLENEPLILRLERSGILPKDLQQFSARFYRDSTYIYVQHKISRCFYSGKVWRGDEVVEDSDVAVDTCVGLRGVVRLKSKFFGIQPIACPRCPRNETKPHVVYPVRDSLITRDVNLKTFVRPFFSFAPHVNTMSLLQDEETKLFAALPRSFSSTVPRLPSREKVKRYILQFEMIVDRSLFDDLNNDLDLAIQYAARIINIAVMLFLPTPIELRLVSTEVWNLEDQVPVTPDFRATLSGLLGYANRTSGQKHNRAVVLLSRVKFQSFTEHISVYDSVCSGRMASVIQVLRLEDYWHVAKVLAVAISEQLGLRAFPCPKGLACLISRPFSFGDLVRIRAALATGISDCLLSSSVNKQALTQQQIPSECGNGRVERGEECDDSSLCCERITCMAKATATCLEGDCCANCQVLKRGHVCRAAESKCDLSESCDGRSGFCPDDMRLEDGQACSGGVCINGTCPSRSKQCQHLWGADAKPAMELCYDEVSSQCRLLKCRDGSAKPLVSLGQHLLHNNTVHSNGTLTHCKFLAPRTALSGVHEGTACSQKSAHFCRNGECKRWTADTAVNGHRSVCPVGITPLPANATSCSGRGVCIVPLNACLCRPQFAGRACEQVNNNYSESNLRKSLEYIYWSQLADSALLPLLNNTKNSGSDDSALTTVYLVTIVGAVAGGLFFFLFLFVACYRKRSYSAGGMMTGKRRQNAMNKRALRQSKYETTSPEDTMERMIKFGHTPSYKEDKLNQIINGSISNIVKPGNDGSICSSSPIPPCYTHIEKSPPERGILKNRNIGELQELANLLSEKLAGGEAGMGNESLCNERVDSMGQDSAGTTTEAESEVDDSCMESCCDFHVGNAGLSKLEQAPVIVCNAGNQTDTLNPLHASLSSPPPLSLSTVSQDVSYNQLLRSESDELVTGSETEVDRALLMHQLERLELRSNAGTCDSDASSLPDGDLLQLASRLPGGLPSAAGRPLHSLAVNSLNAYKPLISPTNPNLATVGATKPDMVGFKFVPPMENIPVRRHSYARATDSNASFDTAIETPTNIASPPLYHLYNETNSFFPSALINCQRLQHSLDLPRQTQRSNGNALPVKTPKAPARSGSLSTPIA